MPYLPTLDGLRALAVTAVLLYHAGLPLHGGFLGVEVFFVLSGFLITALLRDEWLRSRRIDLRNFWYRRARRLLPAMLLALGGTLAIAALLPSAETEGMGGSVLAALGYVQNWYLIASGQPYFDAGTRPPLLQHLWSLAVEEQFYLFWPLLLLFGLRFLHPRLRFVLPLLLAAGSIGLAAALYEPGADPSRIYYGTDTRAGGFLLGATLALLWAPWQTRTGGRRSIGMALDLIGLAALGGLIYAHFVLFGNHPWLYRGGLTLVALGTLLLIVAGSHPQARLLSTGLSWAPLRWLGTRSYSVYLWHWPIFQVTRPYLDVPFDGPLLLAGRIAATLLLAELSFRLIEAPIRQGLPGRIARRLFGRRDPNASESRTPLFNRGRRAISSVLAAGGIAVTAVAAFLALHSALRSPDSAPLAAASAPTITVPPALLATTAIPSATASPAPSATMPPTPSATTEAAVTASATPSNPVARTSATAPTSRTPEATTVSSSSTASSSSEPSASTTPQPARPSTAPAATETSTSIALRISPAATGTPVAPATPRPPATATATTAPTAPPTATTVPTATVPPAAAIATREAGLPPLEPDVVAALQTVLDQSVADGYIPGTVAAVNVPGRQTWTGASGTASHASGRPMTPETRVRIGSVSKMFTAVVVMQLAEEGLLSLDDSLERWKPGLLPRGEQITLRMLLQQRTGLYDFLEDRSFVNGAYRNPNRVYEPQELVDYAEQFPALFRPGASGRWDYSSTNYVILGLVVEAATGNPLAAEMRGRIFEPLGLSGTYFTPDEAVQGPLATGYSRSVAQPEVAMTFAFATANIVSTAGDLQTFNHALLAGDLLKQSSREQMLSFVDGKGQYNMPQLAYGLGLMRNILPVAQGARQGTVYGHIGGFGGFRTAVWHAPVSGITIAVSVNQASTDPNRLATAVLAAAIDGMENNTSVSQ